MSVLSPPNRGDQLSFNSHPTNTSDFQLSTSPHPRSPTEMQNTDSKWDQSASIRRFQPHRNEHALTVTIPHAKTSHHQQEVNPTMMPERANHNEGLNTNGCRTSNSTRYSVLGTRYSLQ